MIRTPIKVLDVTGAADGDVPTYNAATDRLEYAAPPAASGGGATTLDALTDVAISASPKNKALIWYDSADGTWKDAAAGTNYTNPTATGVVDNSNVEAILQGMDATVIAGEAVSVTIDAWGSSNRPSLAKTITFRLRDGGLTGTILQTFSAAATADTSSGHNVHWSWSGSVTPTTNRLVVTAQETTNGSTVYSDTRTFNVVSADIRSGPIPLGGSTRSVLRKKSSSDFDTEWGPGIPAGGTSGQVLTKSSSADDDYNWATPAAGSGGGGSAWSAAVNNNPMTSLTGWSSKAGTWTLGAFGVQQTDATQGNAYLSWASNVPLSAVAMKATIRFPGSTSTWSAGFQLFADDAAVSAPAVSVWLRRDGVIAWDRFGSGGGTYSTGLTLASDTDYDFAVAKRGTMIDVFINGAHIVTITTDTATTWSRRRVGLECRNGQAWFRNVSIWVPATPW